MFKVSSDKMYGNKGNPEILQLVVGNNKTILDIGCGKGDNARILSERGHIVDGITISLEEASVAEMFMRDIYIHDLENGLPEKLDQYDYIICSHVIEHVAYPEKLLRDIYERLKNDGQFLVALPNIMQYRSRFKLLFGDFDYQESGIWDYTHLRWYTLKTGNELLTRANFVTKYKDVSGDIPLLSLFKWLTPQVRNFIYRNILCRISKGFFGVQLIYVAEKR